MGPWGLRFTGRDHRIHCDTETFALYHQVKARMISYLGGVPSDPTAIVLLCRIFLEDEAQGRLGSMIKRLQLEGGLEVR